MASTYTRPDSPYIWIRFKDATGKWKSKNSGLRKDNASDRKIAKRATQELATEEHKVIQNAGRSAFKEWVPGWIELRYGHQQELTLKKYRRITGVWLEYLADVGVTVPAAVTRDVVLDFPSWRQKQGVSRNTCIYEAKFFGMILEEAVRRQYIRDNPGRSLGLKLSEQKHKTAWTDEQIKTAIGAASSADKYGWMHVSFLMGNYQAIRLGQCEVPLQSIDLKGGVIHYPASVMKGGKPFDQMIDPDFLPILTEIVAHRRQLNATTLATLPVLPSVDIRKFLDALGLTGLSHHGLRASWITRAAMKLVPENFARRFVNHASTEIHSIYMRVGATDLGMIFDLLKKS